MKKLFVAFVAIIVATLCSVLVVMAETDDSGVWEYQTYENGVMLTSYNESQTDVYIPDKIEVEGEMLSVIKLGDELFKGNTALNSATLGEGITEIGASAFEGATNLVCIVTPESLTTIGDNAFSGCTSFNSVILYDAVTSIGENAFNGCSKLVIYCNENNYSYLYAIENDINFTAITEGSEPETYTVDGITYYINNGTATAIKVEVNKENYIIPTTVLGYPVTSIGTIFKGNTVVSSVTVPSGVNAIVENAFSNCSNLAKIEILDGVTSFGDFAFNKCENLLTVITPKTLLSIGNSAFNGCKKLTNIEIPYGVTSLGNSAFSDCDMLLQIEIPDSVKSVGKYCFNSCENLMKIKFPCGLTEIEYECMYYCTSLTEVELPDSLTVIGAEAFAGCKSLTNIKIPDNVITIKSRAFRNCSGLINVDVSESLKTIETEAFVGCTSIKWIRLPSNISTMNAYSFPESAILVVTSGSSTLNQAIKNKFLYYISKGVNDEPEIYEIDNVVYFIMDGNAIVVSATECEGDIVIPAYVEGYKVTDLRLAFKGNQKITSIVIPDGVTSIAEAAFNNCRNLKSVVIPYSVSSIGAEAFYYNDLLESVTLEYGLKTIGKSAFSNCKSLKNVTIPNSVTTLGAYAFSSCTELKSVKLSNRLTRISTYAFNGCKKLVDIEILNGVKSIDSYAFYNCSELSGVSIPSTVTTIANYAFANCNSLVKLKIPAKVSSISSQSFPNTTMLIVCEGSYAHTFAQSYNKLYFVITNENDEPEIHFIDGITYSVLNGKVSILKVDSSLTKVVIAESVSGYPVTDIGTVFKGNTNITSVKIPKGVTSIPNDAFSECSSLTRVEIPDGVTSIGSYAFYRCQKLNSINMPETVKSIGSYAFYYCYRMTSIKIPDGVTSIGYYTFGSCSSLSRVELPESVTSIETYAFYYCGFEKIELPENLTSIGSYAFKGCTKLKSIKIPEKVNYIGSYAFEFCILLDNVKIPLAVKRINEGTFEQCYALSNISLHNEITYIGTAAFSQCKLLTTIDLPDSITSISEYMFDSCEQLIEIEIPESVTVIGNYAFNKCSELSKINIPKKVNAIGSYAFSGCVALSKVNIPESVVTIGDYAFADCGRIINIKIPDNVISIGNYAFSGCGKLYKVILPEGITAIGDYAFADCKSLLTIKVPDSVVNIYTTSFKDTTILIVCENSYIHTFATENNLLHFIVQKKDNPEIAYGIEMNGKVTFANGAVVSNATVEILYDDGTVKESVETDSEGYYEFTYAEVGRYTIRATDKDGNTASEIVSVKRMNVFDVYIAGNTNLILKNSYMVSGTVSAETATVTIADKKGNILSTQTVTDGKFAFANITRGEYIVKAETENGSNTVSVYVSNEDVTDINIVVEEQSASISGMTKVENRDGTYFKKNWISIELYNSGGEVVATAKTDSDGNYTFKNVPFGSYNVVAKTSEIRPAYGANFDKSFELTGYGYVDVTEYKEYIVDIIILREEKVNLIDISGKVTTDAGGKVILSDENGNQLQVLNIKNDGEYKFEDVADGLYVITAATDSDGVGFVIITIKNGIISGETDIKPIKANNVKKLESMLDDVPDEINPETALYYKDVICEVKEIYDRWAPGNSKQVSTQFIEKLNMYIDYYATISLTVEGDATVENIESVVAHNELDETIEFTLTVTKTQVKEAGENGITTNEEYETEKIKDKKGKNKEIAEYYDITLSKNGQRISDIQKQTETNGKLLVTIEIPEEFKGYKDYSIIHMHYGETKTLVDLDDNPDTITFEVDKFSTFALTYSKEKAEKVNPANITYNAQTGKISVTSTQNGKLYIATYEGDSFVKADIYDVVADASAEEYDFALNQAAFIWDENLQPLCKKFKLNN